MKQLCESKTSTTNLVILGWTSVVLFIGGIALIIVAIEMTIKDKRRRRQGTTTSAATTKEEDD